MALLYLKGILFLPAACAMLLVLDCGESRIEVGASGE